MKYALVDGTRSEASKGDKGICPCCRSELIAKCGKIRVHHWAHKNVIECDPWWEPETEWHRNWKDEFPIDWQEFVMHDFENNEKHIADVYNPSKRLVIEFQNSPMTIDELKSREQFYKRIIWVVNAENFDIELLSFQSITKEIEDVEQKYLINRENSFFKIPHLIREKLVKKTNEILENKKLSELHIEGLMNLYNAEFSTLVSQYKIGDLQAEGVDPASLKNEMLEPIFSRIRKDVNKILKENETSNKIDKYYGYKWSRKREVWSWSGEHVFFDRGQYLFWLRSDWVLRKIPREEFIRHYKKEESIKGLD